MTNLPPITPKMIGEKRFVPWPMVAFADREVAERLPSVGTKGEFGYLDCGRWWERPAHQSHCMTSGFVGNSRFASSSTEAVIPRTNRAAQRKAVKR